ncbi:hypothetical protein [Janthinobacterium sp. 17J80-10]|uniref:hypothetical protein n=1 Tax=Janthinobacterium sp. 17J80-10 TaxID=2497863 RepID=UPI001005794D|nr:hypothetical protein [Janthinobacterium sp. 17J80-10]QAU34045.1 hypothetical protein EKL02_07485 [Janthinobacterium sp. 17J80-10]
MSSHHSLTDEKQALLERMQASRTAYQRMLLGQDEKELPLAETLATNNVFPRSKTMRWIRDHPYLTLLGLTGAVLATRPGPRQAARSLVHRGSGAALAFSRNHQAIRSAIGIAAMLARAIAQRRIR